MYFNTLKERFRDHARKLQELPDKTARFFYEKGKSDAVTEFEKESKNINMTRNSPTIQPQSGLQVKAVEEAKAE